MVLTNMIYWRFFPNTDAKSISTVAEYQQYFIEHLNQNILFIAITSPLIAYFIYKNFPRNLDVAKLPYCVNGRSESM